MEQRQSARIIDSIFLMLSVFILSLIWIRYFFHNTVLIYLFSAIITIIICAIIHIFFKKKHKNQEKTAKKQQNIDILSNFLLFQGKKG